MNRGPTNRGPTTLFSSRYCTISWFCSPVIMPSAMTIASGPTISTNMYSVKRRAKLRDSDTYQT